MPRVLAPLALSFLSLAGCNASKASKASTSQGGGSASANASTSSGSVASGAGGQGGAGAGGADTSASSSAAQRARFESLPRAVTAPPLKRDVLLRRPSYFDVLAGIWGDDATAPGDTLVCGDVWELDLAMPAALGCQAHLVTRSAPYATYEHERRAAEAMGARGGVSAGLRAVLDRVRAGAS